MLSSYRICIILCLTPTLPISSERMVCRRVKNAAVKMSRLEGTSRWTERSNQYRKRVRSVESSVVSPPPVIEQTTCHDTMAVISTRFIASLQLKPCQCAPPASRKDTDRSCPAGYVRRGRGEERSRRRKGCPQKPASTRIRRKHQRQRAAPLTAQPSYRATVLQIIRAQVVNPFKVDILTPRAGLK